MKSLPSRILHLGVLCLATVWPSALRADELQRLDNVQYLESTWADGDSFPVRLADGKKVTIRLYGADCLESSVSDDSDARRLRAQRRYFGISDFGGDPSASIDLAKRLGKEGGMESRRQLAKPFTVYTSFADGRGDERYERIYAFITTSEGKDLASVLVEKGLARAYGVARSAPDGSSREDYRALLADKELIAARKSQGVWQYTDWDSLPEERRLQRQEDAELELAIGNAKASPPDAPISINTASRDDLMRLPGIGETIALGIIEHRPFRKLEDLSRVPRIGEKTIEALRPYVKL